MKNIAASVHQRLLNIASVEGSDFNATVLRYANERFLARLTASRHGDSFVLKGATMFLVWMGTSPRRTRDLGLLGFGAPTADRLVPIFREILGAEVEEDGLLFYPETVRGAPIREERSYLGLRLSFDGVIGRMRVPMQVDVGFGDGVYPEPAMVVIPPLLGHAAPRLRGYAMETSIAEKFAAMLEHGVANSRMKDYFDIWLLSERFDFDHRLIRAVQETLLRRRLEVPQQASFGLTEDFATDLAKQMQWRGFVRKAAVDSGLTLAVVVGRARELLAPVWAGHGGERWERGGPWKSSSPSIDQLR